MLRGLAVTFELLGHEDDASFAVLYFIINLRIQLLAHANWKVDEVSFVFVYSLGQVAFAVFHTSDARHIEQ